MRLLNTNLESTTTRRQQHQRPRRGNDNSSPGNLCSAELKMTIQLAAFSVTYIAGIQVSKMFNLCNKDWQRLSFDEDIGYLCKI